MNRREILQAGLAGSTLSLTGLAAAADGAAASAAPLRLECFVSDARYAESLTAARYAQRHGLAVHATSGDMTDLWYNRLSRLWKREPVAVAGVTGEDALFVVERLGWDHGLRAVYRGRHGTAPDGRVGHELQGAASLVRVLADAAELLESDPGAWAARLAGALARCRSDVARETRLRCIGAGGAPLAASGGDGLVSWLLAPAPGAPPRALSAAG